MEIATSGFGHLGVRVWVELGRVAGSLRISLLGACSITVLFKTRVRDLQTAIGPTRTLSAADWLRCMGWRNSHLVGGFLSVRVLI